MPFRRRCLSLKAVLDSTSFQLDGRPPGDLCSKAINFLLRAFSLGARALTFAILAPPRIDTFPFESDSGTMRKVLKWGVVPLNLEGHGMNPHSLCWAMTNAPVNIRRFNSKIYKLKLIRHLDIWSFIFRRLGGRHSASSDDKAQAQRPARQTTPLASTRILSSLLFLSLSHLLAIRVTNSHPA